MTAKVRFEPEGRLLEAQLGENLRQLAIASGVFIRSDCNGNGTCGKCIERCPIGAITKEGHNKILCRAYVNMTRQYVFRHYGFEGYGCGFCQTNVPCESKIPEKMN